VDHAAPPRGPDGLDLDIPRNEEGLLQPISWVQLYALWLGMATKTIPVEAAFDLSKLPEVLKADDIVAVQPMTAPCGKWWKEAKTKTAIALKVPERHLFPNVDEESRRQFVDAIFKHNSSSRGVCDECPGVGECDDDTEPKECGPKLCEHGSVEGQCPWPVGECEHAAPEDYIYVDYKESGVKEYGVDAFQARVEYPKVKMKRSPKPFFEGGRFIEYGWGWSVYCLAKPKMDPVTGEVTWEDDPDTMARW